MDLCRQPFGSGCLLYCITIAHAKYPVLSRLCIPKCTTSVQYSIGKNSVPSRHWRLLAQQRTGWRTVLCFICLFSLHFSWEHKHKQRESKICVLKWNYRVAAIFPERFQSFTSALKIVFFVLIILLKSVSVVCRSVNKNKQTHLGKDESSGSDSSHDSLRASRRMYLEIDYELWRNQKSHWLQHYLGQFWIKIQK